MIFHYFNTSHKCLLCYGIFSNMKSRRWWTAKSRTTHRRASPCIRSWTSSLTIRTSGSGYRVICCDDAFNHISDFKDYLIAFEKMLKNGYNSEDLVEGPQKWFGAVCTKNWETRGSGEFVWRCQ